MRDFKTKYLKELLFLGLLVIFGLIIFFYKLDSIPSGFYVDEALHGYNAYSILQTGKDEYGEFMPLVFRFYGSYNAPLYVYLTALSVKFLGLSIFSVRFLAALSGFLSIFVIHFFLKSLKISTAAGLFFAITPWLLFQSRIGYEISLAFFLFSLGTLALWFSLKNQKYIIPAFLFLSLSTYATYAERFIVPALLLLFFIVFIKKILKKENYNILRLAFILLFLTQIPNLAILLTPAFFPKSDLIASSTIFSQAQKLTSIFPSFLAYSLAFIREFLSQYVNYFSPATLFFTKDVDTPALPPFYSWMVIPYFLGAFLLWKDRGEDSSKFIALLAFLAPIPAAFTKDPFSMHRAMPVVLPIFLIISYGIDKILSFLRPPLKGVLVLGLFVFSLIFLWRSYFVFTPYETARAFSYGFDKLAEEIKPHPDKHFVVDQTRIKLPYVELAFFLKFPPKEFQKSVDQNIKAHYYDNLPYNPYYKFDSVETRPIVWEKDVFQEQILVGDELTVSSRQAKEHFLTKVFEIRDPLEQIVFVGYQTNPKLKCKMSYIEIYCKKYK